MIVDSWEKALKKQESEKEGETEGWLGRNGQFFFFFCNPFQTHRLDLHHIKKMNRSGIFDHTIAAFTVPRISFN